MRGKGSGNRFQESNGPIDFTLNGHHTNAESDGTIVYCSFHSAQLFPELWSIPLIGMRQLNRFLRREIERPIPLSASFLLLVRKLLLELQCVTQGKPLRPGFAEMFDELLLQLSKFRVFP